MKKLISLIALVFVLTIAGAFAAFEVTEASFGSEGQQRGEAVSAAVSVKNLDDMLEISSIKMEFTATGKYVSNGVAEVVNKEVGSLSLGENESASVTLEGNIPLNLDAVDSLGKIARIKVGDLKVTVTYSDDSTESKTVAVYMQAENRLRFDSDSRIKYGDEDVKLRDDKTYSDVKRGDEVTIDLVVGNTFDSDGECDEGTGDCDIDDIEIEFEPDDSEFDDDSDDISSVRADDVDMLSFAFDVPDDIDEDEYRFELFMVGEDENGAKHGDYWRFSIEIEVPKDEITITSLSLTPSSLSCSQRFTTLRVTIENTGKDDQSKASIFIEENLLGIDEKFLNLDMDEGDTVTKTLDIEIPEDADPRTYNFIVSANYDYDEQTDLQSIPLVINECVVIPEEPPVEEEEDSNTDVNIIEIPPSSGVIVGEEKEESFFDSPQYLMLLGGLFIVALLVFLLLIVLILRK